MDGVCPLRPEPLVMLAVVILSHPVYSGPTFRSLVSNPASVAIPSVGQEAQVLRHMKPSRQCFELFKVHAHDCDAR